MTRRNDGMTLVEIIVVVAVLALLVAIAIPVTARIREKSRRQECASNLRQIGLAIKQYSQDDTECFPSTWHSDWRGGWGSAYVPPRPGCGIRSLTMIYPVYIDDPRIFSCPSAPSEWRNIERNDAILKAVDTSYSYDPRHSDTHKSGVVMLADKTPGVAGKNSANHGGDGQNICFIDTHVEWDTDDAPATGYDVSIWTDDSGNGRFETDSYLID